MWQCLCTIFAGSGRTETSFHKWKSIDALGPEYERTKQDIIGNYARYCRYLNSTNSSLCHNVDVWDPNLSGNSLNAFKVLVEREYVHRFRGTQRYQARVVSSAGGEPLSAAAVGDTIPEALNKLLLGVRQLRGPPPGYHCPGDLLVRSRVQS